MALAETLAKPTKHIIIILLLCLGACKKNPGPPPTKGKTTHSTSAGVASLKDKQSFVEKYVTFRRTYAGLEYKIDYEDDTSRVPGPSATSCDIRLYAVVPDSETKDWTAGLEPFSPQPLELNWTRDIPNAPSSSDGFTWYAAPPSSFGGSKLVGFTPGKAKADLFYRVICARN